MIYYVYKIVRGEKILHWSGEGREYAAKVEDELRRELRKKDPYGVTMDAMMISHNELQKEKAAIDRWDHLSEQEKADIVEVDGRRFVKAVLSERVKAFREKTGLSQAKFGAKYEIPTRTIEDWERGIRTPSPWALNLLERVVAEDFGQ